MSQQALPTFLFMFSPESDDSRDMEVLGIQQGENHKKALKTLLDRLKYSTDDTEVGLAQDWYYSQRKVCFLVSGMEDVNQNGEVLSDESGTTTNEVETEPTSYNHVSAEDRDDANEE